MTDTTAQIAAKGCKSTGITEELAVKLHDQLGKKLMCVVELVAAARTENTDGKQKVQLQILSVEPAVEQVADDHLREFQRALYMNRALDDAQPTLDDGPEPTVKDVLARGDALFEKDDDGEVTGLWDGNTDPEPADRDNPAFEPHAYVDTAHAVCGFYDCGQPAGATIHDRETLEQDEDDVA